MYRYHEFVDPNRPKSFIDKVFDYGLLTWLFGIPVGLFVGAVNSPSSEIKPQSPVEQEYRIHKDSRGRTIMKEKNYILGSPYIVDEDSDGIADYREFPRRYGRGAIPVRRGELNEQDRAKFRNVIYKLDGGEE